MVAAWAVSRRESAASSAPSAAPVAAPVSLPTEPAGAWRDLPSLQRTLAEPLRPVAVGDDFRQSLASFTDPSFVAPLSHHVDPSTGGLVDGLAAPGRPHAHPSVSELPVPARPAAPSAPRVQRSVAWSGSTDLPTVGWELPGLPADEPVEPSPESPPVTSSQVEPSAPVPASAPLRLLRLPPLAGCLLLRRRPRCRCSVRWRRCRRARRRKASYRRSRSANFRSWSPGRRRTDRRTEMSAPEVQPATPDLPATPPGPAAEQAPLSGFAEAITSLGGSDEGPAEPPVGPAGEDRPVAGPSIQRLTADVEAPVGRRASPIAVEVTPGVAPPSPGSPTVAALPVVSRLASRLARGIQSPSTSAGMPWPTSSDPARRADDAPTLGTGLAQKPLAVQRAPLTGRTATPGGTSGAAGGVPGPADRDRCRPVDDPDAGRSPRRLGVSRRAWDGSGRREGHRRRLSPRPA